MKGVINNHTPEQRMYTNDWLRLTGYSLIGIIMFFFPVKIANMESIPIDHIVSYIRKLFPQGVEFYAFAVIIYGAIRPFLQKTWKQDVTTIFFSACKIISIPIAVIAIWKLGPAWLHQSDMIPFLFQKLVISVGLLVPVGSIFLAFLTSYGLMEFIGVFMQPVMRPIWRTPGRSAVDAVASFVGSYSLALLITNRVFKEGKYTIREASIIATGFSTVSATFMVIIAKTLNMMEFWNFYFWSTMVITFAVTALTTYLPPLKNKPNEYINKPQPEEKVTGNYFHRALEEGLTVARTAPSLLASISSSFKDGMVMAAGILPSILSIGLAGLLVAKYTPLFDWLGYLFYPITLLFSFALPEPLLVAKACAVGIAEMFLPALLVIDAPMAVKYTVAVVSVSGILFFSASIPCILSTEIPLTVGDLVLIWFLRVILTLLLTIPVALILF